MSTEGPAGALAGARRALAETQRMSLQAKLSLLLGVVAMLPLLILGLALVSVSREALRVDALNAAAGSAQLGAGLAQRYVMDARHVIEEVAGRPIVVAAARAGDTATMEAVLNRQLRQFNEQFDTFVWRDSNGDLRARAGSTAAAREIAAGRLQREAFAAALLQPGSSVGPANRSAVSGRPVVPIAAAIRDGDTTRGAIVGTIDLTTLGDTLSRFRPDPSRSQMPPGCCSPRTT